MANRQTVIPDQGVGAHSVRPGSCRPRRVGFTLIELLVVIGIIAVLLAILLPSLQAVQRSARNLQCMANLRQIAQGLINYAAMNRDRFPINRDTPAPGKYWCQEEQMGPYLKLRNSISNAQLGGNVLVCPEDPDAVRSYGMNIWASSAVDPMIRNSGGGVLFKARTIGVNPSRLILVTEVWSQYGSATVGWYGRPTVGSMGVAIASPGRRFGGGGGIGPYFAGRWGMVNCELPYQRHRQGRTPSGVQPQGRINIAYADSHVETRSDQDLVDSGSGRSTLDSLWSPLDEGIND